MQNTSAVFQALLNFNYFGNYINDDERITECITIINLSTH